MILANGILYDTKEQNKVLDGLKDKLTATLTGAPLERETVVSAFDSLGKDLAAGKLNDLIDSIDLDGKDYYLDMMGDMMSRKFLEDKIALELYSDLKGSDRIKTKQIPLGVIFHIAAGNMDVLPIVSIAEGLLAGNINILKLPQADSGLTIKALKILIDREPRLKDHIYVFDTPSSDIATMQKLADLSDGISVWGGDEAVKAVRQMSRPGTRLIEWGHKLGFAYISGFEDKENELKSLAEHIMLTKQLLCSSCQVIYIDTDKYENVVAFAEEFISYLENAALKYPVTELGGVAELTLRRYAERIDRHISSEDPSTDNDKIIRGQSTSITVKKDSKLELSYMYGNVIIKPLPSDNIASVLRDSKEYLQTAGLICEPDKREKLSELIYRCGLERVTRAGHMSEFFKGEAHDGEYPLARYSRFVNIEY